MQEFVIAPAGARAALIALLVLVPVFALLALSLLGSRTSRFIVSPEGLRLRGDLYGRLIPAAQLNVASAARIDFARSPDLRPARRTLGTGLPGYAAGWFRLANGEKALLYLTDRTRAVYLPTNAGYSILISPTDPEGFLATLRTTIPAQ